MNAWVLTGFGLNVGMIVMAVGWALARRVRNAGSLDVASSCGFAVVACFYAAVGPGEPLRKWLIAGMVTIWSLRLAALFLLDLIRNHPQEGPRYLALREHFPKRPWLMFFGFSQYLAALIALLSVPFAIACSNSAPGLKAAEIAAVILWLVALCAETVAKAPLRRYLANREAAPRTRDPSLSRYALAPHYFSEWLVWFAYFLFALGSPWGWTTFYCPLIAFYSLTTAKALLPRPPGPLIESRMKHSGHA